MKISFFQFVFILFGFLQAQSENVSIESTTVLANSSPNSISNSTIFINTTIAGKLQNGAKAIEICSSVFLKFTLFTLFLKI